jgi:hypothetical protein
MTQRLGRHLPRHAGPSRGRIHDPTHLARQQGPLLRRRPQQWTTLAASFQQVRQQLRVPSRSGTPRSPGYVDPQFSAAARSRTRAELGASAARSRTAAESPSDPAARYANRSCTTSPAARLPPGTTIPAPAMHRHPAARTRPAHSGRTVRSARRSPGSPADATAACSGAHCSVPVDARVPAAEAVVPPAAAASQCVQQHGPAVCSELIRFRGSVPRRTDTPDSLPGSDLACVATHRSPSWRNEHGVDGCD